MSVNERNYRGAKRTVPMKVLALGFSRTGTASMRLALEMLGYKEVNHGYHVWTSPGQRAMWTEAINAKYFGKGKPYGRAEFDQLLGHCEAVTDSPHILFAQELIDAYPEAKVVLPMRSPDSWWKSYKETIGVALGSSVGAFNAWLEPDTAGKVREFWRIATIAMFGTEAPTEAVAKARYVQYYDDVRRMVPKERLLEYKIGDWHSLCAFLERPLPIKEFPRVNDTQAYHDHLKANVLPLWKRAASRMLVRYFVPLAVASAAVYVYGIDNVRALLPANVQALVPTAFSS